MARKRRARATAPRPAAPPPPDTPPPDPPSSAPSSQSVASEYAEGILREIHQLEEQRRDYLNAQLSLPVAITTVLCGVVAYYVDKCPDLRTDFARPDWPLTLFVLFLTALAVAVTIATGFLIAAIHNYWYRYPSDPDDLKVYIDGLRNYYEYYPSGDDPAAPSSFTKDLRELMIEQYAECAKTNRYANIVKANRIHYANWAIIAALIALGLSLIPYHMGVRSKKDVQLVQIVKPAERSDANGR